MNYDILEERKIKNFSKNNFNITVFDSLPSTNTELKKLASDGASEGTVLIARTQTGGRGRLGRSFYSPKDSGIYMSMLLRPDFDAFHSSLMTPAAAVSVSRALKNAGAKNIGIKWVNDIFCKDRKVAGILTEIGFKKNTTDIDFLIVGIGINITTDDFPEDLKQIAGSVFSQKQADKNKIAADTLDNLFDFYKNIEKRDFLDEYKNLSILKDRDVLLICPAGERPAKVIGINDDCNLIVGFPDGTIENICTGEISVRF